jgi:hypothetical protein
MPHDHSRLSRRSFLKRAAAISAGAISARGIYGLLDEMLTAQPARAATTAATRPNEQYLIDGLDMVTDNGVTVVIPPLYHDVVTATLATATTAQALFAAQVRLERALSAIEAAHPPTPQGLTIIVGWGLPYFREYLPAALVERMLPVDRAYSTQTGTRQHVLLDARRFPSDRDEMVVEHNDVMFLLRSDSQSIIAAAQRALFEDQSSPHYIGDLLTITSVRKGFVGRGFGTRSIAKQLAQAAEIAGWEQIPDKAQLMMGFTSTQHGALAPDNLVSFETMPGVTDQWPNGYFVGGCSMHLSHMFEDLNLWYGSFDHTARVSRMFHPRTFAAPDTVTVPNDISHGSTHAQLLQDASGGLLGHNATLQQANRLITSVADNYGKQRPAGTALSLRADFNTLDNPFAFSSRPNIDQWNPDIAATGMHFVSFTATSQQFHAMRLAMDGVLPNGTNLREEPYNISDSANGINRIIRATHRQNYLIPPRSHRAFPLAELLDGIRHQYIPLVMSGS